MPVLILSPESFGRGLVIAFLLSFMSGTSTRATILTFEDFTTINVNVNTTANPFGAGQYGSRASSAISGGFQQGDGWTPNVALTWAAGWQTYTGWPFGNDAQTGPGRVAQADFSAAGGSPLTLTMTPDAGIGVRLKSFAFTVWNNSPSVPVQIRWTVYGGMISPANVLATGTSSAVGSTGGAETIITGLAEVHSAATSVILRWELLSGDATYVAINNVHFSQGPARQPAILTWDEPDAILVGTALSGTELNAQANVAGAFDYTPPAGTILSAGAHSLAVQFTPSDTNTYAPAAAGVELLVKSNNVAVISVTAPQKIGTNDPLSTNMFVTSADVRGAFTFVPSLGTRLPQGTNVLEVIFTPAKQIFTTVTAYVAMVVLPSVPEGTVWTFADPANRLRPLCGDDELTYHDTNNTGWPATKIAFGTAASFGILVPPGGDKSLMRFSHTLATEGLKVAFNDPPNGVYAGNGWLSNYSFIFDVLYPSNGAVRPLFNANLNNTGAAEAFINSAATGAVQVSGISYGAIRANTWHRIAIVVRSSPAEGQAHVYIDGTFVGAIGSNDSIISAGYALERIVYMLTSGTGNGSVGYLSGLQFVGRNLDYAEINALGGVHAEGPHVPGAAAPRPPFQPLREVVIIGHRGNGGFAPEDTLPAFLSTFAAGGHVVEIDVRRTSDNRVVAMHDGTVDRTTDGTGSVGSMTLAQIQALDAGSWFGPQFAGTRPPALREIMEAVSGSYPGAILYLDLKIAGMASLVKADADATGYPYELIWFWVYNNTTEAASYRSLFPNAKIIWGEDGWANGASIYTWLSLTSAQKQSVVTGMKARGVWGFDFGDNEANALNPTVLQELRAAGFFVSIYSALHPRSMTSAINYLGVDGMETDFPPVLRALMPFYAATTTASPLSDAAARVAWTPFPTNSVAEIRLRAKPKAGPVWTNVMTGVSPGVRVANATGLRTNTVYEFQPIGYDSGGNPITFGRVAETNTLPSGNNFTNAYAAWQAQYAGVGMPEANADGDSYLNAVEYFLGFNPIEATPVSAIAPTVTLENNELQMQYARRAGTFMNATYEGSADLQTWVPLLELVDYEITIAPGAPGMETVTVSLRTPSSGAYWFVRLSAQAIP